MTVVFAILLFSLLIFVHELGHFLTAKAFGVQVNEFALFMGPAIFKKQVGQTLYSIRCIPFGGYCAMEGEDADTDNPRSFQKAAWWKRLIILVAGSAMNLIMGIILMFIVFGPTKQIVEPVISGFTDYCTVDGEQGLQVGDEILEVDGEKIYVQSDFSLILYFNEGDTHDLVVRRNGEKVAINDLLMEKHEVVNKDGTTSMFYGMNFTERDLDFAGKFEYAWLNCVDTVRNVRLSLQMLLSGRVGLNEVSGPVGIVSQMSQVAEASPTWFIALMNMLYFGGYIAINLAVMNLLPIPALDGGRAVCLLLTAGWEAITKKKIDPKYEGYLHAVGMILLLILMAVILFKDIFTIFKG